MISDEDYSELIANKEETEFEDVIVNLNDESLAKLEDNDYFLVQRNDEDYDGTLTLKEYDYKLAIIKPEKSKLELIKDGEPLTLVIYNNNNYELRNIYLSYLPVIEITNSEYYEWGDYGKDVYTSILSVYSYDEDTSAYNKQVYNAKYNARGNMTVSFDKKSYSVDLIDEEGNKINESLLGMREDDDWNLLSMGTDASFMKEKLSMDIWKQISPYSIESRYVELIKGGQYMGLYLLSEPTDIKTLNGDSQNDILVKISNWYDKDFYEETLVDESICIKQDKCILEDITFKNLEYNQEDRQKMYQIAKAFHLYYEGQESNMFEFDYENCLEYSLFLQLVMGTDNTYKNERILLVKDGDKYKLTKGAWDFDYNFKAEYVYTDFYDYVLPLAWKDSKDYYKDVANLYETIKDYYNEDNLISKIEEYNEYITNSGVLKRLVKNNFYVESENYDTAVSTLKNVIKQRTAYVDSYYENILKGE